MSSHSTRPFRADRTLVALSLTVVLASGALSACTSDGSSEPPTTGASTTAPSPAPGVPSTPAGPPASTASAIGTATQAPVAVGVGADFGDGLVATVTSVDDATLSGEGPGEVAGPGVAVSMTLSNGTDARVDLGGVVVNVAYADGAPGDVSSSRPADVPSGILEPGDSADGVWVFSRPTAELGPVEVSISSISSPNIVVVRS